MAALLETLSDALDRLCRWGAIAGVVAMVLLIAIQVFARYVLREPPGWTEEGARYAMVWAGLLGATLAFRRGTDPVLAKLALFETGAGRTAAAVIRVVAVLLFLAPIGWFCVFGPGWDITRGYVARSLARATESMGITMAWFTVALPLAVAVILIHLAADVAGRRAAAGDAASGSGETI